MLYVVMKATNEILWRDDAWDAECVNKAEDFMTQEGLLCIKEETTFNGDLVLWVRKL